MSAEVRPRAEEAPLRYLVRWVEQPEDGAAPELPEPEVYLSAENAAIRVARLLKDMGGDREGYNDLPTLREDARALLRVAEEIRADVFVGPLYLSVKRAEAVTRTETFDPGDEVAGGSRSEPSAAREH